MGSKVIAALIGAGLSMAVVVTLGGPLIPAIADRYGVPVDTAQWVLTISLVTGAVATPALGRLGDGAGPRRVLIWTLAIVLAGCVLSAVAGSFGLLLAGRALQGAGYGILPLTYVLARRHATGPQLASGIAVLSITVVIGSGLSSPLTGLVAEVVAPNEAYWVGALATLVALVGVLAFVPPDQGERSGERFDLLGAVLLGAGLAVGLVAVTRAPAEGWGSPLVLGAFGASAVLLAVWVWVELRRRDPLIDVRLMRDPTISAANLMALLVSVGLYSGYSLINRFVQEPESTGFGFGATALGAGLVLAPVAVGSLLAPPVRRRMRSDHHVLVGGAALQAATMLVLVVTHEGIWIFCAANVLMGLSIGLAYSVMPEVIMNVAPPGRTGSATSLNQVLRSAGGALGSAASITVLELASPGAPTEAAFAWAFGATAAACVVAALVGVALGPAFRRPPPGALEPIPAAP